VDSPENDLKIAQEALDNGEYEEALKISDSILEKFPGNAKTLLLRGRILKAQKLANLDSAFNKGMKYYKANDFEQAMEMFVLIDADYGRYDQVRKILDQLENVDTVEEAYQQALSDFDSGNLDKAKESVRYVLNTLPVFKKGVELEQQLDEVEKAFLAIKKLKPAESPAELEKLLNRILSLVPQDQNFFNQFSRSQLRDLKTGKNLKSELFYASGIEALAKSQYGIAYEHLNKAASLQPDVIKFKISLTEARNKRQKLIKHYFEAASVMEAKNPRKAKMLLKKIVAMGEDSNEYYPVALKKLEN